VSIIFTCIIALINFGPVVGFNAIVSLTIIAITASYTICIVALIWRRFFGKPIPKERFSLGRWGLLVNIIALACTAPLTILVLWVQAALVQPQAIADPVVTDSHQYQTRRPPR